MANHRAKRVAEEIKRELATLLRDELKDPRVGFVTITSVEVSGDIRYAKVFLSVMGNEEQAIGSVQVLKNAHGFLRSELGKILRLRYMPELVFEIDKSIEYGSKIEKLLAQVNTEKGE